MVTERNKGAMSAKSRQSASAGSTRSKSSGRNAVEVDTYEQRIPTNLSLGLKESQMVGVMNDNSVNQVQH